MLESLQHCPVCEHNRFEHHLNCKDYTVSKEAFDIAKCVQCDFVFTNPRPTISDISSYYESEEYISHHNKSQGIIDVLYKIVRNYTLAYKVKLIKTYGKPGSLLDIGCGTGFFLNKAKSAGLTVKGVEPNSTARAIASSNGIEVNTSIEEYPSDKFDNITLWHVLEHVHDLNEFIKQLKNRLSSDGTIFVAVPNYKSYDSQHYGNIWAAYDVPRHLYHFSQKTMAALMHKHQLEIIDTKPMKFDAFYVSLLSENHLKRSPINYIKFLINGIKSNRFALRNNNDYSSLIYIIKKS